MSTLASEPQSKPRVSLDALLARLRAKIRTYLWLRGVALVVVALGAAFWGLLALDWLFEPSRDVRTVLAVVAGLGVAYVAYQRLVVQALAPLADRNLAVLVERRFREFGDSLLTTVEIDPRNRELPAATREMLAATRQYALDRAQHVQVDRLLRPEPRNRALAMAGALLLSIAILAIAAPEIFGLFVSRITTDNDALYPRRTRLEIEGFPQGERVVARGDDVKIVVNAATDMTVPDRVDIRYETEDGTHERRNMVRVGQAAAGEPYQRFEYQFQGLLSTLDFDVRGGDARLRDLRIRVVDSPTIQARLRVEYPSYTRLSQREIPASAATPIPRGSVVTVRAAANKDLVRVHVDAVHGDELLFSREIPIPAAPTSAREFEFTLPPLLVDTSLSFTLQDADGIQNREPIRLTLIAAPDAPPTVNVRLAGIGSAVTPQARLPLAGEASDDYGINRLWLDVVLDESPSFEHSLAANPSGHVAVPVAEAIELEQIASLLAAKKLKLEPGHKMIVAVKAADNQDLPDARQPNVASGERFLLDIVTPEQLRAILEARELNLRQTFERVIEEVVETRDSLTRLESGESAADAPAAQAPGAAAPGDEPAGDSAQRAVERTRLRLQRALQGTRKSAQEIDGIAQAFDSIREELVNNRVDTEELRIRLKDRIADPLHQVASEMCPELERRLSDVEAVTSGSPAAIQAAGARALEQSDAVAVALERIRDNMLELETFNEAIDLLRAIVDAQRRLTEETKAARDAKVKSLLD